jgi:GNAT superfamily N-acetyltransferase
MTDRDTPDLDVSIVRAGSITPEEHAAVFEVFDASYRDANHEYLQRSIDRIGLLSLATHEGRGVGYSISHTRWMDLSGFAKPQLVQLHWMRAVLPEFRHRGVNRATNRAVMGAMKQELKAIGRPRTRQLSCGRYGHAAGAGGRTDPSAVPTLGETPTAWQQAVGLAVAEAYGSTLDPETFVCIGPGTPIGYPNEAFPPTEAERDAYALVDRDRGDNLLVINWIPDGPPRWNDPSVEV